MKRTERVIAVLTESRDRLKPQGAWTQNALARNEKGWSIWATHHKAVCWCMSGSVIKTVGDPTDLFRDASMALGYAINSAVGSEVSSLAEYNDNPKRTQDEVIETFDKAIASLKAKDR